MKKDIQNIDTITYKLKPALAKKINLRKKKVKKKQKIVDRQKAKTIVEKQ